MNCRIAPYEGIRPYIFFSYCHRDEEAVIPIIEHLAEEGYRVWYDDGIHPGDDWLEVIADHLNRAECCLSMLTPAASQSHNCRNETNLAMELGKPVVSVLLEDFSLSLAVRLQLGASQFVRRSDYAGDEEFYAKLLTASVFEPCLGEKAVLIQRDPGKDEAREKLMTVRLTREDYEFINNREENARELERLRTEREKLEELCREAQRRQQELAEAKEQSERRYNEERQAWISHGEEEQKRLLAEWEEIKRLRRETEEHERQWKEKEERFLFDAKKEEEDRLAREEEERRCLLREREEIEQLRRELEGREAQRAEREAEEQARREAEDRARREAEEAEHKQLLRERQEIELLLEEAKQLEEKRREREENERAERDAEEYERLLRTSEEREELRRERSELEALRRETKEQEELIRKREEQDRAYLLEKQAEIDRLYREIEEKEARRQERERLDGMRRDAQKQEWIERERAEHERLAREREEIEQMRAEAEERELTYRRQREQDEQRRAAEEREREARAEQEAQQLKEKRDEIERLREELKQRERQHLEVLEAEKNELERIKEEQKQTEQKGDEPAQQQMPAQNKPVEPEASAQTEENEAESTEAEDGATTILSRAEEQVSFPYCALIDVKTKNVFYSYNKVLRIGRKKGECDLAFPSDSAISRHHADIICSPVGAYLADAHSANGSLVNGEPVGQDNKVLLDDVSVLRFHNVELVFISGKGLRSVFEEGKLPILRQTGSDNYMILSEGVHTVSRYGRMTGGYFSDTAISRKHASLTVKGSDVIVVDLGSTNGTFINDVMIEPNKEYMLPAGASLCVGKTVLVHEILELKEGKV